MRYEKKVFKPLTPAQYPALISSVTEGTWQSGDPYIEVIFNIEDPETLNTISITNRVSPFISDSPKYRLFGDLIALLKKEPGDSGEFDPQDLLGLEVLATTTLEADKKDPTKQYARVVSVTKKK